MAEPASTSGLTLAALGIAVLGPLAGPYAVIVFAAMAGALWPLSSATTDSKSAGAWLLLRCTTTAVALTVALSSYLQKAYEVPVNESLGLVAFFIGAFGNGWRPVIDAVSVAVLGAAKRLAGQDSNKEGGNP